MAERLIKVRQAVYTYEFAATYTGLKTVKVSPYRLTKKELRQICEQEGKHFLQVSRKENVYEMPVGVFIANATGVTTPEGHYELKGGISI